MVQGFGDRLLCSGIRSLLPKNLSRVAARAGRHFGGQKEIDTRLAQSPVHEAFDGSLGEGKRLTDRRDLAVSKRLPDPEVRGVDPDPTIHRRPGDDPAIPTDCRADDESA